MSSTTIPDPSDANDAEAIFAAWAARVEAGEDVPLEDTIAAHPEQAGALAALHADWKLFGPLLRLAVPGRIDESAGIVIPPLSSVGGSDANAPSPELLERLGIQTPDSGRYRFRAVLGRGGGGVVLKVWDSKLNRPLAMKVVLGRDVERPGGETPPVDSRTLTRFVDEARIASQLNHPGIVPVHELGTNAGGRAFFTMKLVKGEDLSQILAHVKTGRDGWNQTRALGVLLRVCESVAFAHEKGVIHRDLKPANIMVGRHGEVYVMDWGLARVLSEEDHRDVRVRPPAATSALLTVRGRRPEGDADSPLYTMDGDVVGTPAYMAPEQAAGRLDQMGPHSDVYAVGAMIYHLLAGHMPYVPEGARLNNYAVWQRVQEGPPTPIEQLVPRAPLELVAICGKAMARDIAGRYRDMNKLSEDLRAFLEDRVVSAHATGAWAETWKWVKRNRNQAATALTLLLVLVIGLVVSMTLKRRSDYNASLAELRTKETRSQLYEATMIGAAGAFNSGEIANMRAQLGRSPVELRNWEWRYFDAKSDTSLIALKGHSERVRSARFSPDGMAIVTASDDNTARIWNAHLGTELMRLVGHTNKVSSARFSPDGGRIVTASADKSARVWSAVTGASQVLMVHPERVTSAAFRPDAERLLTSAGTIAYQWSADSGALLGKLEHEFPVVQAQYLSNGMNVITSSESGFHVWNAETSIELTTFLHVWTQTVYHPDGSGAARGARFCIGEEGEFVATWTPFDSAVCVWNTTTWSLVGILQSSDTVKDVAFGAGDARLAISVGDEVQVWSVPQLTKVVSIPLSATSVTYCNNSTRLLVEVDEYTMRLVEGESGVEQLAFYSCGSSLARLSPDDGEVLAISRDECVRVWNSNLDTLPLQPTWTIENNRGAVFSPDGSRIVSVQSNSAIEVWDADLAIRLSRVEGNVSPNTMPIYSPDGKFLSWALYDGSMRMSDGDSLALRADLRGHEGLVRGVAFDKSGNKFASCGDDGTARIWNPRTGDLTAVCGGSGELVWCVCFSDDGSRIATGDEAGVVRIWDTSTGRALAEFDVAERSVVGISYGNDSSVIFAWTLDEVYVLEANSGEVRAQLKGGGFGSAVEFREPYLVALGGAFSECAYRYDLSSSSPPVRYDAQRSWVRAIAWSPDGSRIVTGEGDGAIRVWESATGAQLARFQAHVKGVDGLCFSADGTRLLSASDDHRLRVWDTTPYRIRLAEGRLIRAEEARATALVQDVVSSTGGRIDAGESLRRNAHISRALRRAAFNILAQSNDAGD